MKLVTFEGLDGSGKSTGMRYVSKLLTSKKIPHIVTREPGGCVGAEKLRKLLMSSTDFSPAPALLMLYAARLEHIQQTILPALKEGKIVLCDRFIDSSMAYQGYGDGLKGLVHSLDSVVLKLLQIDHTLYFDACDLTLNTRLKNRRGNNKYDVIDQKKRNLIRTGYASCRAYNKERFVTIRSDGDIASVKKQLQQFVTKSLLPFNLDLFQFSESK